MKLRLVRNKHFCICATRSRVACSLIAPPFSVSRKQISRRLSSSAELSSPLDKYLYTGLYRIFTLKIQEASRQRRPSAPFGPRHITMADRSGPTAYYLAQLQAFRRADKDRDDMVADLVIKYEELMLKYRVSQDDLENEVEARRMWKTKADITAKEAGDLRRAAVRSITLLYPNDHVLCTQNTPSSHPFFCLAVFLCSKRSYDFRHD